MDSAIVIHKLSKRYSSKAPYALKDLKLEVNTGEVFGFLGPNGAGKSTTIRTLLNFIQPTSGSATILGMDIVKDSVAIRKRLGYLSGDFRAYDKMTGHQFLAYMAELQPPKRKTRVKELASIFNINLHKRIGTLSKGNRQKIGLIQAFMHEPDILILDEPTDGLDPLMQEAFYDLVRKAKEHGVTIFVSSHNLAEVKKICDRVAIIKNGVLVSQENIANLAQNAAQTLIITFKDTAPVAELRKLPDTKVTPHKDGTVSLHVHGSLSPIFSLLAKHHVTHLATQEFNLEDEFMRFYDKGSST